MALSVYVPYKNASVLQNSAEKKCVQIIKLWNHTLHNTEKNTYYVSKTSIKKNTNHFDNKRSREPLEHVHEHGKTMQPARKTSPQCYFQCNMKVCKINITLDNTKKIPAMSQKPQSKRIQTILTTKSLGNH